MGHIDEVVIVNASARDESKMCLGEGVGGEEGTQKRKEKFAFAFTCSITIISRENIEVIIFPNLFIRMNTDSAIILSNSNKFMIYTSILECSLD